MKTLIVVIFPPAQAVEAFNQTRNFKAPVPTIKPRQGAILGISVVLLTIT